MGVNFPLQAAVDAHLLAHPAHRFVPLRLTWLRTGAGQVCGLLLPFPTPAAAELFSLYFADSKAKALRAYSLANANRQYLRKLDTKRELADIRMQRVYEENERARNAPPAPIGRGSLRHYLPKEHPLYRPETPEPVRPVTEAGEHVLPGHEHLANDLLDEETDEEPRGADYV